MLKVVIIDDEEWIRFLIKDIVPWEEIGMKIVGEAGDGIQGLALCKKVNPDIVLTDIRMPGIDGLGLLQEYTAVNPSIIGIILSGHSDFAYAQTAIAYGVYRYILKPIDEDELIKTLHNAKQEIEKRHKEQSKLEKLTTVVRKMQNSGENDQYYLSDEGSSAAIKKALALINEDYGANLTMESIADRIYLNASYFSDLFRREMGKTFTEYLGELRIDKARELLKNPDLKMNEIALLTGFIDPNYFAKVFKKYVGLTPSQYREEFFTKKAEPDQSCAN
jgi:two-component system response regulator YesN